MMICMALMVTGSAIGASNFLDISCCTHHFQRTMADGTPYNERNFGIRYRHYYHKNRALSVAVYKNSEYRTSYAVGEVTTWELSKDLDISLDYGLVSGYERSALLPYIIPVLSYKKTIHLHVVPISKGGIALSFTAVRW